MNLQHLADGWSAQMMRERAKSQMTLGQLIAALEALPAGEMIADLGRPHSYRGYYSDLAFERTPASRSAGEVLADCKSVLGEVLQGYKGGDYPMHKGVPVWVAAYGECGRKLMSIHPELVLQDDD